MTIGTTKRKAIGTDLISWLSGSPWSSFSYYSASVIQAALSRHCDPSVYFGTFRLIIPKYIFWWIYFVRESSSACRKVQDNADLTRWRIELFERYQNKSFTWLYSLITWIAFDVMVMLWCELCFGCALFSFFSSLCFPFWGRVCLDRIGKLPQRPAHIGPLAKTFGGPRC